MLNKLAEEEDRRISRILYDLAEQDRKIFAVLDELARKDMEILDQMK